MRPVPMLRRFQIRDIRSRHLDDHGQGDSLLLRMTALRLTGIVRSMKYDRFEDLPVWKAAIDLADRVYGFTRDAVFVQPGDLRDQLRRAALSISNNIAEGFERGTTPELLMFLYIARGSAGEVRSMLQFVDRLVDQLPDAVHMKSQISNLKSQISDLKSLAESCSRQLRAWADTLQNSDIKGQRHLTDDSRRAYEASRSADAYCKMLEQQHRRKVDEWQRSMQGGSTRETPDA